MENCVRGRAGGRVREDAGSSSLPLPPPPRLAAANSSAAAASIRAHLARTASGVDAQPSPRSLLSRILLRGGGDGGSGGGGGFGCRVRLPRRYGGGLREERKDGAEQGETPRVKVVEPPPPPLPELPLETPRSSLGRKKPEEELVSMNLGLGASLVLLLSKSAVELNKMVELRAQMEALVSEIRQAARYREEEEKQAANHPASVAAAAAAGPATSQESDGGSSATTTAVKDPIAFPAADADAASNCSRTAVVMDLMEAELQAELSRMQQQRGRGGTVVHGHGGDSRIAPTRGLELPLLKVKTKGDAPDSASRSCVDYDDGGCDKDDDNDEVDGEGEEDDDGDEEEEEDDVEYGEDRMSPPHGGVSARALERRLHELLQKRQQDRIVELESALDSAQRRLHEKEREVVWWRDAAKLVSHRRDESRRIATASAR
ncbi:Protein POLAR LOCALIZATION DURING ASYMMETRIC DIVISION AND REDISTRIBUTION [Zea mays]|uniref:Protein POLAR LOCALIZATION DURING ASYMMETRIC DIVISION AND REDISTRIBUTION n=1 Tax=Zea mays TaxID=4577 RepID=A0A3L6D9H7_MAIZE|nr:Protein POLAR LOCALIZATION DURING ASYMMETRIC DIVISION AND REDISTRIBUTION [Zea mays]